MKILLIIYLASVIYYFLGFILVRATIRSDIKKEGIKIQEYSSAEIVLGWVRVIVVGFIPIINILIGSIFLFSDKYREESIKNARERKI